MDVANLKKKTTTSRKTAAKQKRFSDIQASVGVHIIGQEDLIERMLICMLCDGHMLIEGMPGLAKTTAAKALADSIEGDFHRVQFTPDLLPSDLVGTDIYIHDKGTFEFRQGPIFHNIVLADEINRAPAKVQSALLEAMAEKQVTVGQKSYELPELFMVLATQNPVEQEGTYHLPEAQLDRFLMHVIVGYPERGEELQILEMDNDRQHAKKTKPKPITPQKTIFAARQEAADLFIDPKLKEYILSVVHATREPEAYNDTLKGWFRFGASPRASIALARCARALAWLRGDSYVSPYHIQSVAPDILRHRVSLSFEAEAEGITKDHALQELLELVAVP